ncbi:unnamed protein product [Cuscuta epithymum]|uniref:Uncharacterized protein n=1 Tax=Cuscuta epithymum TaxID=186058 RepID=A0AAV0CL73_9ASTE|nr:unnamed protein product [Cuscuta epithymum]
MYDPSSKVKPIIPSKSVISNASDNAATNTVIKTRSIPMKNSTRFSTSNNPGSDTTVGEKHDPRPLPRSPAQRTLVHYPPTRNTKIQSNNITLYYTIEMYKRYFTSKRVAHFTLCI